MTNCTKIANKYREQVERVVSSQVVDGKEAIFFIYGDGTTSSVYQGERRSISLSTQQEEKIASNGEIVGSVHSHPSGFEPSTIDIMTGIMTSQNAMCVASPVRDQSIDEDFVLTCLDLDDLSILDRRRMLRAMRRSSISITEFGRQLRKQANIQRFSVDKCRTHDLELEGVEYPVTARSSLFNFTIGEFDSVKPIDE
jgi:proteasome lid subunit RPN8/RPN11